MLSTSLQICAGGVEFRCIVATAVCTFLRPLAFGVSSRSCLPFWRVWRDHSFSLGREAKDHEVAQFCLDAEHYLGVGHCEAPPEGLLVGHTDCGWGHWVETMLVVLFIAAAGVGH